MSRGRFHPTGAPTSAADRIAQAGMQAMEAAAEAEDGAKLGDALIFVTLDESPDGINASTHPHMASEDEVPDSASILAFACSHVMSIAKALGIPLRMSIAGAELGRGRRRPTPQRGRPPR